MAKESESQQLLQYHLKCLNDSEIPRTEQRVKRLQFLQQNAILKTVLPEGVVEQFNLHHSFNQSNSNTNAQQSNQQHNQQQQQSHQTQSQSRQRNSLPEIDNQIINSSSSSTSHQLISQATGRRTGPGPAPERDPRKEIRFSGGNKIPVILQIRGYHRDLCNQEVLEFLQNVKLQLENVGSIEIEFAIKGYVYIKFNNKKDAYLYLKKLLNIRKNDNYWSDIKTEFIPFIPKLDDQMSPLLVFINSKSGGGDGQTLYMKLINCLDKEQVYRLEKGGPCPGLVAFRHQPHFRILACGGDGTCSWVMSVLEEMKQCITKDGFLNMACQNPPIGVIPLGTGNDLARVLGYGGGYTVDNSDGVVSYIRKVQNAIPKELDRWSLSFKPETVETSSNLHNNTDDSSNAANLNTTPVNSVTTVNTNSNNTPDVIISSTSLPKQRQTNNNNIPPQKSSTDNNNTRPHTTPAQIERQAQISKEPSNFKPAPLRKTPTFTSEMPTNRYGSRMSYIVRPEFIKDVLIDSEAETQKEQTENKTNDVKNGLPRQSSEAETTTSASDNKHTSESDHSDEDSVGLSECEEALHSNSLNDISEIDPVEMKCMTNYFSVGLDAELALSFHRAREEHPERFNSRLYNKSVYVKSAMKRMTSDFTDVSTMVKLTADSKCIKIPKVYGGGQKLWRSGGKWKSCQISDGKLEVIGLSISDMFKVFTGLGGGKRLAQAKNITIEIKEEVAVQIDGEPWMQDPCTE